jgi:hypothetical protein
LSLIKLLKLGVEQGNFLKGAKIRKIFFREGENLKENIWQWLQVFFK